MIVLKWFQKIRSLTLILFNKHVVGARIGNLSRINGGTVLSSNTVVGENSHFNGARIYGNGKVSIGKNFHSGKGLIILTQNHNYYGLVLPYDDTYIVKDTIVEDNVWLGINVTILPGIKIGEGAIIQAGSVVVSDIPKLSIAGGNPAKTFSNRDSLHYFRLIKN